jgi:hypothetical protein
MIVRDDVPIRIQDDPAAGTTRNDQLLLRATIEVSNSVTPLGTVFRIYGHHSRLDARRRFRYGAGLRIG